MNTDPNVTRKLAESDGFLTEETFETVKRALRQTWFDLLSGGYIEFIDVMGSDRRIVEAARTTSNIGAVGDKDDRNLLRYLMRHRHSTPFEFCEIVIKVAIPMDGWRQWIRHRTASVNEFSTRYSEVPDNYDKTPNDKWRAQSVVNRQGSAGTLPDEFPDKLEVLPTYTDSDGALRLAPVTKEEVEKHTGWTVFERVEVEGGNNPGTRLEPLVTFATQTRSEITLGMYLSAREAELHAMLREIYAERIDLGVAKEQARKDLPLSTYTVAYWKCDLHNILHFLGLRMDKHAQLEIRSYANVLGNNIVAQLFPVTWQAFIDYRLEAVTLTRLDQQVIRYLMTVPAGEANLSPQSDMWPAGWGTVKCRERDECIEKLRGLQLLPPA